jgi:hypothetical protein
MEQNIKVMLKSADFLMLTNEFYFWRQKFFLQNKVNI